MKTLKYIFTIVMLTLVANSAFAQFSFDTKKCKYTQLAMVNKSEWSIQPNGEFAPKSENALLYQKAEKCSGWYIQPGAFASIIDGSKFAPMAEIIFGLDFCCGHSSNIAVSLEAKAACQRFYIEI